MKNIKKIYNDSKELVNQYIKVAIICAVLIVFHYSYLDSIIKNLLPIAVPLAYFIYIKTDNGKRNFNTASKAVSIIYIVLSIFQLIAVINKIKYGTGSILGVLGLVDYALPLLFYLYWIAVFFLKDDKSKKIFKGKFNSNMICKVLIITNIVMALISLLLFYNFMESFKVMNIIMLTAISLLQLLLRIMQIRYVALYQEFKERKEK